MKSTVEFQVALRGLRGIGRKKKSQSYAVADLWVEELVARNYWVVLSERSQTERSGGYGVRHNLTHGVAGNAA